MLVVFEFLLKFFVWIVFWKGDDIFNLLLVLFDFVDLIVIFLFWLEWFMDELEYRLYFLVLLLEISILFEIGVELRILFLLLMFREFFWLFCWVEFLEWFVVLIELYLVFFVCDLFDFCKEFDCLWNFWDFGFVKLFCWNSILKVDFDGVIDYGLLWCCILCGVMWLFFLYVIW